MSATAAVVSNDTASYLTIAESAAYSGLSFNTIARYIKANRLPATKAPKNGRVRILISSADLDRALAPVPVSPVVNLDAELNEAVVKLVAAAPRLNDEQRASLAVLLGGASV